MASIALFHGMTKTMCSTVPQHRSGIPVSLNFKVKFNFQRFKFKHYRCQPCMHSQCAIKNIRKESKGSSNNNHMKYFLPYLSSHVSNLSWQSPIRGRPISQSSIPPAGSSISSPSALQTPACCNCNSSVHRYNPPPTQKIIVQRLTNYFTQFTSSSSI